MDDSGTPGSTGHGQELPPTVGVEEEYFVVDPATRAVVPAGPRLAARGSGAHRQRAAHRAGGLPAIEDDLANCMATPQAVPPRSSARQTPQGHDLDGCASVKEAGRARGPMSTDARERP
ncbi:hypothetical protein [Kitasatospora sp. NPDC054795]